MKSGADGKGPRPSFILSTEDENVQLCELQGQRPEQQDSSFIGKAHNPLAEKDPVAFLDIEARKAIKNHQHHNSGTTVCALLLNSVKKDGEDSFRITVLNQGDCGAVLVMKFIDENEKIFVVQDDLTKDMTPETHREEIQKRGGFVIKYTDSKSGKSISRVNGQLAIGAPLGDKISGLAFDENGNLQDCFYRNPEVTDYYLSDRAKLHGNGAKLIGASIYVRCDGLIEKQGNNFLKETQEEFDRNPIQYSATANRAEHAALRAYNLGSTDNITAGSVDLLKSVIKESAAAGKTEVQTSLVKYEKPVMMLVADGHGNIPKIKDPATNQIKTLTLGSDFINEAPGEIVSASVAADFFNAAKIEQFPGVEVVKADGQDHFSKFVRERAGKERVPVAEDPYLKIKIMYKIFMTFFSNQLLSDGLIQIMEAKKNSEILEVIDDEKYHLNEEDILAFCRNFLPQDLELDQQQKQQNEQKKFHQIKNKFPELFNLRIAHLIVPIFQALQKRVEHCREQEIQISQPSSQEFSGSQSFGEEIVGEVGEIDGYETDSSISYTTYSDIGSRTDSEAEHKLDFVTDGDAIDEIIAGLDAEKAAQVGAAAAEVKPSPISRKRGLENSAESLTASAAASSEVKRVKSSSSSSSRY